MGFIGLNTARWLVKVGEQVVISRHGAHRVPEFLRDELGSRVFTARLDVGEPLRVWMCG